MSLSDSRGVFRYVMGFLLLCVAAIAQSVVQVGAGSQHTVILLSDGTVWAAGLNSSGQLSDGTTNDSALFKLIASDVTAIAAGGGQTALIKRDQTLWVAGYNRDGQLGDGTTISRSTPVQLASQVEAVSMSGGHILFVKTDKTLWGVGDSTFAQLGSGGFFFRPIQLTTDVVAAFAGGSHSLFLKSDGALWALGDVDSGTNMVPRQFQTGIKAFGGFYNIFFVKLNGELWGQGGNGSGDLGDGTYFPRHSPIQIATGVKSVVGPDSHTAFLKEDGTVWAMGSNFRGKLGDGTETARFTPVQVASDVAAVTASSGATFFIKTDGTLWATGDNTSGAFGNGTHTSQSRPVQIYPLVTAVAPTIQTQPASQSAGVGGAVTFTVAASGSPAPTYQWQKNGGSIPGATSSTLTLSPVSLTDAGSYSVVVSNSAGSVTSDSATLVVTAAPAIVTQPVSQSAKVGDTVTLTVTASGSPAPTYQWLKNGGLIVGATSSTLTLSSVSLTDAGDYSVVVISSSGSVTSEKATLAVTAPTRSRLSNIAARGFCGQGNKVAIGGFVVAGTASKRLLVRAVGPSLTAQGLSAAEVLTDPLIEVHQASSGRIIETNDNWNANANAAEITTTAGVIGASALLATDTKSAALLVTLAPGVYSFVAKGHGDTSGIVLLEVYDADADSTGTTLSNIATRAHSTTGNGVTIGGFVIAGSQSKQVLLRALGPTLTTQQLDRSEVLADPAIELHDASNGNATIETNDNWGDNANAAEIVTTGARIGATPIDQADTKSAALLLTLKPGAYSFLASGQGANPSGIVLVEVYDAD